MLIDGEEIKLLIAKDLNLLRGIFLMGEMSKFFGCWVGFFPVPRVTHKGSGIGEQSRPGECNSFVTFLVRREMPGV